jgi:dihydroorotate dehydrogenase (NAD+) catalytic subunit
MNLSPNFLDLKLANPLVLASGLLGVTGANMASVVKSGAGAITSKSVWLKRHDGHPNPTIIHLGSGNLINAVGLPHGGIEEAQIEFENFRKLSKAPLFASVAAASEEEYVEIVTAVAKLKPDLIEVNISCPNVADELGKPFECDLELTERLTKKAKEQCGEIPLSIKISANTENYIQVAQAVEKGGADAVTAINTIGPGLVIDIESSEPILANKVGGLSGPDIRPLAVKAVYDISQNVGIPIIGTGGVSNGRDAIEMLQAGATLVGIGSAVIDGAKVFKKITKEMKTWCEDHDIENISELVGKAHKN